MPKITSLLVLLLSIIFFPFDVRTQVHKGKRRTPDRTAVTIYQAEIGSSNRNQNLENTVGLENQARFRSPFRYIIFSNLTEEDLGLDIPQRRLEVLLDAKAYSLKNLKLLFGILANRFSSPVRLEIKVHTSLATIETPEEMEMMSDHASREKYYDYHKTATYDRSDDGSDAIIYRYGKPPGFWEKIVVSPKPKPTK